MNLVILVFFRCCLVELKKKKKIVTVAQTQRPHVREKKPIQLTVMTGRARVAVVLCDLRRTDWLLASREPWLKALIYERLFFLTTDDQYNSAIAYTLKEKRYV